MAVTLVLDTAHEACTVGLVAGGVVIADQQELRARGHAERLIPMVQEVLMAAGNPVVTRVVTTLGPGSYTGLRMALAAARAFGLAWGCPVLGVSSLAALAAAPGGPAGDRLVLQSAGRGQVYMQTFHADGHPLGAPHAVSAGVAQEHAVQHGSCTGSFGGTGMVKWGGSDFPQVSAIAGLADRGQATDDLVPLYVGGTYEAVWQQLTQAPA